LLYENWALIIPDPGVVIIGRPGNNRGAVLAGLTICFLWIEADPLGNRLMQAITRYMEKGNWLKQHLIARTTYTGQFLMGAFLLVVMRFLPKDLISEK
jgi:branched-chain amino acid transport system permease protein